MGDTWMESQMSRHRGAAPLTDQDGENNRSYSETRPRPPARDYRARTHQLVDAPVIPRLRHGPQRRSVPVTLISQSPVLSPEPDINSCFRQAAEAHA